MHNFPYNAKGINELVNYDEHLVDKRFFMTIGMLIYIEIQNKATKC